MTLCFNLILSKQLPQSAIKVKLFVGSKYFEAMGTYLCDLCACLWEGGALGFLLSSRVHDSYTSNWRFLHIVLYILSVAFNSSPWVLFTIFKLCKWYQITQSITYIFLRKLTQSSIHLFHRNVFDYYIKLFHISPKLMRYRNCKEWLGFWKSLTPRYFCFVILLMTYITSSKYRSILQYWEKTFRVFWLPYISHCIWQYTKELETLSKLHLQLSFYWLSEILFEKGWCFASKIYIIWEMFSTSSHVT